MAAGSSASSSPLSSPAHHDGGAEDSDDPFALDPTQSRKYEATGPRPGQGHVSDALDSNQPAAAEPVTNGHAKQDQAQAQAQVRDRDRDRDRAAAHTNGITNGTTNGITGPDGSAGVRERPPKRKRSETSVSPDSGHKKPKAISPPWRKIEAEGPSTFTDNGRRKSGRLNLIPIEVQPQSERRKTRGSALHVSQPGPLRPAAPNGPLSNPNCSPRTTPTKTKPAATAGPAAAAAAPAKTSKSPTSHPTRKSSSRRTSRQEVTARNTRASRRISPLPAAAAASTPAPTPPPPPARQPARSRRQTRSSHGNENARTTETAPVESAGRSVPKIKLRVRPTVVPLVHPDQAKGHPKISTSFEEWWLSAGAIPVTAGGLLIEDEPVYTAELAAKDGEIIDRIERETQPGGILSEARCSAFASEPLPEPPAQYSHADHLTKAAANLRRLMFAERQRHRAIAKKLADACRDRWLERQPKSADELEAEAREMWVGKYKSVLRLVVGTWENVKAEINRRRYEEYQAEEQRRVKAALNQAVNLSEQKLAKRAGGQAMSDDDDDDLDLDDDDDDLDDDDDDDDMEDGIASDEQAGSESDLEADNGKGLDEDGDDDGDNSIAHSDDDQDDDKNMSSSDDEEEEAQRAGADEDLTQEQLRIKYANLPDLELDREDAGQEDPEEDTGLDATSDESIDMDDDLGSSDEGDYSEAESDVKSEQSDHNHRPGLLLSMLYAKSDIKKLRGGVKYGPGRHREHDDQGSDDDTEEEREASEGGGEENYVDDVGLAGYDTGSAGWTDYEEDGEEEDEVSLIQHPDDLVVRKSDSTPTATQPPPEAGDIDLSIGTEKSITRLTVPAMANGTTDSPIRQLLLNRTCSYTGPDGPIPILPPSVDQDTVMGQEMGSDLRSSDPSDLARIIKNAPPLLDIPHHPRGSSPDPPQCPGVEEPSPESLSNQESAASPEWSEDGTADSRKPPFQDTETSLGSSQSHCGPDDEAGPARREGTAAGASDDPARTGTDLAPSRRSDESPSQLPAATHIEIPFLLRGTLREYQHRGLEWLAGLYANNTNGILADEMGLGKTIQTIALLAHLACHHEVWGPHLIIVPTSVMLNWEMEFKKWCPGFKIMPYYGSIEERRRKRTGWTNDDIWNVCITSYQLVLQDQQVFRRRRWHYMILDEAHNIKNFESQRWRVLLRFNTQSRLLLTGTPLQNNLRELWSLLFFLMPEEEASGGFAGLEEFSKWFGRPESQILQNGRDTMDAEARAVIAQLHHLLRPYLLRRLKSDVEKQMPAKYEHVEMCRLSKRQRELYDGFLARTDTRATLAGGNYLSIINCLMQLRKVCNHPDLFVDRPIMTSLRMRRSVPAGYGHTERLIRRRLAPRPMTTVDLGFLNFIPARYEHISTTTADRIARLTAQRILNELRDVQKCRVDAVGGGGGTRTGAAQDHQATVSSALADLERRSRESRFFELRHCAYVTALRKQQCPLYGSNVVEMLTIGTAARPHQPRPRLARQVLDWLEDGTSSFLEAMTPTVDQRARSLETTIAKFACVTPAVVTGGDLTRLLLGERGCQAFRDEDLRLSRPVRWAPFMPREAPQDPWHESRMRLSIQFPDKRLLQYDCGKLQVLDRLLRQLQAGGHRALIFTQMTKVLDILEQFLNMHGHKYLRLDGATKVEQRQILMDRFNHDTRILCFILSSRSGGLGINLTGADTVIFYDQDWNPAMDKQCQDRCHRIGQTRDVHIYRLVSEHTIEANILRKAAQKQMLDDVVIQEGEFTTDYFNRLSVRDVIGDHAVAADASEGADADRLLLEGSGGGSSRIRAKVLLEQAEDREDVAAAKAAEKETWADDADFVDERPVDKEAAVAGAEPGAGPEDGESVAAAAAGLVELNAWGGRMGTIDDYMLGLMRFLVKGTAIEFPRDSKKSKKKGKDTRKR